MFPWFLQRSFPYGIILESETMHGKYDCRQLISKSWTNAWICVEFQELDVDTQHLIVVCLSRIVVCLSRTIVTLNGSFVLLHFSFFLCFYLFIYLKIEES